MIRAAVLPLAAAVLAAAPLPASAANTTIDSFNDAKRTLERSVYFDHRITFYCRAEFDSKKNVMLPVGFTTPKHEKRARRVEWEHVVPAENFGRAFVEWREGHEKCVDSKGRAFKGRRCAEKVNKTYRYMQSDLYNLYPAIGAVNAIRSNYRFTELPDAPNTFGTCPVKVDGSRVEPPDYTKGAVARTNLYMAEAYPQYRLSSAQRKLMEAWNKNHPVDEWECLRAKRIARIQGNENRFVEQACRAAGLR